MIRPAVKNDDKVYSIKRLFKPPHQKALPNFDFKQIAQHAANKGAKNTRRLQLQKQDNTYRITKLFRDKKSNQYKIEKINEYYNEKYKALRSAWKIHGDVDIFQIHEVLTELVNKMTATLPENVKLQVVLENTKNDRFNQTKFLSKQEVVNKLSDWVNFFIDYHDMEMEDMVIKLIAIELPTASGKRVNAIITSSKRSIIQIRNIDTICLARSVVTGLAVQNQEKLLDIFKNNLTNAEVAEINKGRHIKSQINRGVLLDNEKTYLIQGRKLQTVLAEALHRICNIPVKRQGNDLQDVKHFEEKLDIEIQIYNLETRQIYQGLDKNVKIYILMSENHFDVISSLQGFKGTNDDCKAKKLKCKACNNKIKCDTTVPKITCKNCNKYFYGKSCFDSHVENKRCIEFSYMCKACHKYFKTRELKSADHRCEDVKCGNCHKFLGRDHRCYMMRKDLKPTSEKYIFYDFETTLEHKTSKHIVNYCVAQYFDGACVTFVTLDDFCKWVFDKSKHKGYVFSTLWKGVRFSICCRMADISRR